MLHHAFVECLTKNVSGRAQLVSLSLFLGRPRLSGGFLEPRALTGHWEDLHLLLRSQLYIFGSPFWVRFLWMWLFTFKYNHWGNHILSSWMMHAVCVFVAGIHQSRSWMSGSFESVGWNACVHRLDLILYSHPKEFWENGVRFHSNSKGKPPLPEAQRRIELTTLHHAGQWAQHTTD